MDPVTAIGVASAAVQFLQFSLQILNTCRQIRDSSQSSTEHNKELEKAVRTIRATRKDLEAQATVPRRVSSIVRDCVQLSEKLIELLEHIRGANRDISVAKAIFRALRDQRKIEKLENSLKEKHSLLNQVLLQDTWIQSQLLVVEQSKGFDKLDQRIQDLVKDLLEKSQQVSDNLTKLDLNHQTELRRLGQNVSIGFDSAERRAQGRFATAQRESQARHDQLELAQKRERLLNSLFFTDIHTRRQNIRDPAPETVEWIFSPPPEYAADGWDSFVAWLQDGASTTYWIRGKAGSGKSTLMAHIVDDNRTAANIKTSCGNRELCLLSFYFWKPGSELQRSTVGLLRSLLFQICQARPSLIDVILTPMSTSVDRLGTWTEKVLVSSITAALSSTSDMLFAIFIDALDEYSGDTNALLDLVLDLGRFASVKCCISSRPEIQIIKRLGSCKQLLLEKLNHNSIKSFVASKLADVDLDDGAKRKIEQHIVHNAGGVFLWTALVVQDVISGVDSGDNDFRVLTKRIDLLPQELEDLFTAMLSKVHPLHQVNLALYISMVENPLRSNTDLHFPISLITAVRMIDVVEKQPFSYAYFAKLCAQTETQVIAQSAGLLVVDHDRRLTIDLTSKYAEYCFVKYGARSGREADPGIYPRVRLEDRRLLALEVYEGRVINWVHRSAHDFVLGGGAPESISSQLLSPEIPFSRIYDAALWLIAEAPSHAGRDMYCTNTAYRIRHLLHIIRESYQPCALPAEKTLTRLKAIVERMDPSEFESECVPIHRYGSTATRHLSLMLLARMVVDLLVTRDLGSLRICSSLMETRLVPFQCLSALSYALRNNTEDHTRETSDLRDMCTELFARLLVQYEDHHADIDGNRSERTRLVTFSIPFSQCHRRLRVDILPVSTLSFRYHTAPASADTDLLAQNEIATCAKLFLEDDAGWDLDHGLVQRFFNMTGMYRGLGLESSRLSIQFAARMRSSSMTSPLLDDVRVICLPTRVFPTGRNEVSFMYAHYTSYEFKLQDDFEVLETTILLQLSDEARASLERLIAGLAFNSCTELSRQIESCHDMLVRDIWNNAQGLGPTEQLLALACIKTGFAEAFNDDRLKAFGSTLNLTYI